MSSRLQGKVAIITGSTYGIGRATAALFAAEGASVVVNGRSAKRGESIAREIGEAGGEAVFFQADLTEAGAMTRLVEFAVEKYGRLDVMMNNAYDARYGPTEDISEEDWSYSINASLGTVFLGCKYAIPHMKKLGKGSIINMSSVHGYLGASRSAPYEAAKAAIINLTRQVAVECGPHGIRANAICPGHILIEKYVEHWDKNPELLRRESELYPLRRTGQPVEVAKVALFLASDESSFITGHSIVADGGLTAQLQDTLYETFDRYYRETLAKEWGVKLE